MIKLQTTRDEQEEKLRALTQRLTLIERKISTLQKTLPQLLNSDLWHETFRELVVLQREEIRVQKDREALWIFHTNQQQGRPDSEEAQVIPLRGDL